MKRVFRLLPTILMMFIGAAASTAQTQNEWNCPDGETTRQAFLSGEAKSWPNYAEDAGARVQRQHPKTALIGQAKFVSWDTHTFAICQYYNHIGLTLTFGAQDLTKATLAAGAYWRSEYVAPTTEADVSGQEMIDVCIQDHEGLAYPSLNCIFNIPEVR